MDRIAKEFHILSPKFFIDENNIFIEIGEDIQ